MPRTRRTADQERCAVLREMLVSRRREIQDKLRSLRESLPSELNDVRDAEEQSVDDYVHEVDLALMQMKSETLAKIDEAVARLEQGQYGVCAECGEPISAARLKALPFASLCRDCQADEEQRRAAERAPRAFLSAFAGEEAEAR